MSENSRGVGIRTVLISGLVLSLVVVLFVNLNPLRSMAQAREVSLDRGKEADAARLSRLADVYLTDGRSRAREAEAARLTGLAHRLVEGDPDCQLVAMTQAQRADAERWTNQAEHATRSFIHRKPVLDRGRMAAAIRLSGIADALGLAVDVAAPALACLGGP